MTPTKPDVLTEEQIDKWRKSIVMVMGSHSADAEREINALCDQALAYLPESKRADDLAERLRVAEKDAERMYFVMEQARNVCSTLDGGFIRCENCGEQEDTTDIDFAPELKHALKEYDAALKGATNDQD